MKREIELPTLVDLKKKSISDETLNQIEALVDECLHMGIRHTIQSALQQAYNQGYEDAKPKWLPIESAPKYGAWALVSAGGAINCMYIKRGKLPEDWCRQLSPNVHPCDVTHWMPLPEIE